MEKIKFNEEFRSKVIEELNLCRRNPPQYADKIRSYIKYFKGKILQLPGQIGLMTNEGEDAFKEAADIIQKMSPVPSLKYSPGLNHVAHDYMKEIQKFEDLNDAKKINLKTIIDKYGKCLGDFKMSTDYGAAVPEMIAINLLVDDGDKEREMRNVVFNESFIDIGISTGAHSTYNRCTVIMLAKKFVSKHDENYAKVKDEVVNEEEEDYLSEQFELPEGVERIEKQEKIITENGTKKKIVKIVSYKENGTIATQTRKKNIYI